MNIKLSEVSKRYTSEWILRNVNYSFSSGTIYGIKGANGSGKSTLVKMVSGYLSPTVGDISYTNHDGANIDRDDIYKTCSLWGPHVGLIGKLTVEEMVDYFFTFKKLRGGLSISDFYDRVGLSVKHSQGIASMSSGQTQRLGLGLSILCDSGLLLLDEPGSFLDEPSKAWLQSLLSDYSSDRLVIISSNEPSDLVLAKESLSISDFK